MRKLAASGNYAWGGAVSQKVLLGVETNTWTKKYDWLIDGEMTVTLSNVAATVTWYPTNYFFLKAGPALGVLSLEFEPAGETFTVNDDATGGGFMIGAGGELRLTRKFALVPSAQWMWQRFKSDPQFGAEEDFDFSFFSITLGVGWFW
jgi:hypothetical protein